MDIAACATSRVVEAVVVVVVVSGVVSAQPVLVTRCVGVMRVGLMPPVDGDGSNDDNSVGK